jgi:hypothetical protein
MTEEGWVDGAWAVVWGKETDVPLYLIEPRPEPPWSALDWMLDVWAAPERLEADNGQ